MRSLLVGAVLVLLGACSGLDDLTTGNAADGRTPVRDGGVSDGGAGGGGTAGGGGRRGGGTPAAGGTASAAGGAPSSGGTASAGGGAATSGGTASAGGGAATSGGTASAGGAPTSSAGARSAFSSIEAEAADVLVGGQVGQNAITSWVGYLDDGDSLEFADVDFGAGATSVEFLIAVPASEAGQRLELRLGSRTGALIGTLTVAATADWFSFTRQRTQVSGATGLQRLVLVARGAAGIGNVDRFVFSMGPGAAGGSAGGSATGGGSPTGALPVPGPRLATLQARGAVTAMTGLTISGARITNANGPCISISGVSNVTIVDSELGPCGGGAAIVVTGDTANIRLEHLLVHDSARGVLVDHANDVTTANSVFHTITGRFPEGTAIEYDSVTTGGVISNNVIRGDYHSDAVSGFQSSFLRIVDNRFEVNMTHVHSAAFTIGDSVNGTPGHDNLVARNRVRQTNGVPAGVFGSTGNTVVEDNCLSNGLQAYDYNDAPFVGVTVRNNVIGPGSFVPDPSVITGWATNTFPATTPACN